MKFFIMGASGFIGNNLLNHLIEEGHEVVIILRRDNGSDIKNVKKIIGNPLREGDWQEEAAKCDFIVNLIGRPIFTRWTPEAQKEIMDTRIEATEIAVKTMEKGIHLKALINANAIGYYGITGDKDVTEESHAGSGFLAEVALKWQDTALKAENFGKRVVIPRFAAVLGKGGGMMQHVIPVFKNYVGGRIGSGSQWFSWIHLKDLCRAIEFISLNDNIRGPVNLSAPKPVSNYEFTKALGKALERPAVFHVPKSVIKLTMGDMASLVLDSIKVLPKVLLSNKFEFLYPDIDTALKDIVSE